MTVNTHHKPTFENALQEQLIYQLQAEGAGMFIPKRSHARGMGLDLHGHVELDPRFVARHLSRWGVQGAITLDWTIAHAAVSSAANSPPRSPILSTLRKRAAPGSFGDHTVKTPAHLQVKKSPWALTRTEAQTRLRAIDPVLVVVHQF